MYWWVLFGCKLLIEILIDENQTGIKLPEKNLYLLLMKIIP